MSEFTKISAINILGTRHGVCLAVCRQHNNFLQTRQLREVEQTWSETSSKVPILGVELGEANSVKTNRKLEKLGQEAWEGRIERG